MVQLAELREISDQAFSSVVAPDLVIEVFQPMSADDLAEACMKVLRTDSPGSVALAWNRMVDKLTAEERLEAEDRIRALGLVFSLMDPKPLERTADEVPSQAATGVTLDVILGQLPGATGGKWNLRSDEVSKNTIPVLLTGSSDQIHSVLKNFGTIEKLFFAAVMLKRGLSGTIEEWLLAAEYILAAGNSQLILCERGIRT